MRHVLLASLAVASAALAGCATNDYVKATITAPCPGVKATLTRVIDGKEQAPFAVYEGDANASAFAQTSAPYFGFDAGWKQTFPAAAAPAAAGPCVAPRSAPAPAAPDCDGGKCCPKEAKEVGAAKPAAPASGCGAPAYTGCDGTPGGHRPEPRGYRAEIAPGTGWPCPSRSPGAATPQSHVPGVVRAVGRGAVGAGRVVGKAAVGVGVTLVHAVPCAVNALVGFVTCLFSPLTQ